MKIAAAILAAFALPLTAVPQAGGNARWERILEPPATNPTAEQCVIVDADLYAHAAPGLRDVRLVQDGQPLPYAMDVSFDTRSGEGAAPLPDDRAEYETVQVIPLHPGAVPDGVHTRTGHPARYMTAEALLSAHVPVERIRLDPAPRDTATLTFRAAARMTLQQAEEVTATLTSNRSAANFTVGANLQDEADVTLDVVDHATNGPQQVVLEMRRREICYRPRSAAPVHLLLGDATALPARYDYALHFQPSTTPLLASMGPMAANPAYRHQPAPAPVLRITARVRLAVMLIIVLGSVVVTGVAVYELKPRR